MRNASSRSRILVFLWLASCSSSAVREVLPEQAEPLYPGPAAWRVIERADIEAPLSEVLRFLPPEPRPISGLGVVVGLPETGDTGDAMLTLLDFVAQRTAEGGLAGEEILAREGTAALAVVEGLLPVSGDPAPPRLRAAGNARALSGGRLLPTPLRPGGTDEPLATAFGPVELLPVTPMGEGGPPDPRRGLVRGIAVRERPDPRRLEFALEREIRGLAEAAAEALREAVPGSEARVASVGGRTVVSLVLAPGPPGPPGAAAPDPAALLSGRLRMRVGDPGRVVVDLPGARVEVLGPDPYLGLVNLRVDGVRIVGVPSWQGRPVRRALVEFPGPGGVPVRVVTGNRLAEVLPVAARAGVTLRGLASGLSQARTAGALRAELEVREAPPAPPADAGASQGGPPGNR